MPHDNTYTLDVVLCEGFEARCLGADGTRYLWHGDCGLKVDAESGVPMLVTDPLQLPEEPWSATAWGKEEMKGATDQPRS